MPEIGELTNMLVDLLLLPVFIVILATGKVPRKGWLLAGALCIVASHVATVAEGYILPVFFDAVEHLSIAAGGISFFLALFPRSMDFASGPGKKRP